MTRPLDRLRRAARAAWRHAAAVVAVVLICAAFIIGLRLGVPPRAEPPPDETQPVQEGTEQTMYTCSMHPQVRLPDPDARCPLCGMELIPVSDLEGAGARRLTISEASAKLADIETTPVVRRFPTAQVRLYGKVVVDETRVARITAYFPGRLERLFVNYVGVPVQRDDHLAEIYSPELIAAFAELRQARLLVDDARATGLVRETSMQTLEAAREKLRLFGLTQEQIDAAERGETDEDAFTIYTPIGGVVTELAAREGDYVDTGSPIATVADLSRLWLDLEAYESQLPLLRWGQHVSFTVESHPGETFHGRISFIEPMIDERTRTAAVRVAADNTDHRLKPGMFATAVATTRLGAGGAVVEGELEGRWVSPMHPTVVKDQPGSCDICGMDLVPAEELVGGGATTPAEPLVVPRSAVLITGKRAVVYVEIPEADAPTYEAREVVLGPRAGDFYIVEQGLLEGERVVNKGAFRIDSSMQINAKPSMMSQAPEEDRDDGMDAASPGAAEFRPSLTPVYHAYFDAQRALAGDDLDAFLNAAEALRAAVDGAADQVLSGDAADAWRRAAAALRIDPPGDLAGARKAFKPMTDAVLALQRRFGHAGGRTWHLAFCPMAFDFEGAHWLQPDDDLRNPYFGAEMLTCGDWRETFEPVAEAPRPDHDPEEDGDG